MRAAQRSNKFGADAVFEADQITAKQLAEWGASSADTDGADLVLEAVGAAASVETPFAPSLVAVLLCLLATSRLWLSFPSNGCHSANSVAGSARSAGVTRKQLNWQPRVRLTCHGL